MKRKILRLGFLALILFVFLRAVAHPRADEPNAGLHVLFIGNSLTYKNDLPKMIAELAKAGVQGPLAYERETPGGCTLEKHWRDGKALAKIQSRKWDFVVLQEHSHAPLQQREAMFEYGKKFDAEIKKSGAKTILYMTWANKNEPENQAAISKAYEELAQDLNAELAPVGNAWKAALAANQHLTLHVIDQKHPNAAGTYLAACVFYATLYGKSPEGLPGKIGGLTDKDARPLQAIAWKTVEKSAAARVSGGG